MIYAGHERLETKLDRCFSRYRSAATDLVWECMNGESLFDGGLLEQPAVMTDAVRYLEYCLREAEEYGERA